MSCIRDLRNSAKKVYFAYARLKISLVIKLNPLISQQFLFDNEFNLKV